MTETAVRDLAEDRAARLDEAGGFWGRRISEDTANARLTFKAAGDGVGAVATRLTAGRHEFTVDEPAGLAGDDAAASPVEYALGALISCQVVVYRLYAHRLGIRVDEISIDAEGDLDVRGLFGAGDGVRPGFEAVRLKVEITGPETPERYEELRRTVDAHCPVLDLFANPTPVSIELARK
ncbi:OsmC family protein [Arthrobacter sp. I2-34]|uniref:OsmC family protein n=1 Tax=Arthrobacter hankyongi TaxID=2904801 RepID=A0ABS9L3D2_9MICC|nr:OsmC family protein [Arthrobacter hankyongi]MCG2621159.1 OsmC family protein [Arthrobacter hankyongi]